MRYLILFCMALFVSDPAFAGKDDSIPPPIRAMTTYCLPPLAEGKPPADLAVDAKLPEFAPQQAVKFAPEGGRVFALPEAEGNAVLVLNKNYMGVCSVAVREMKAQDFWKGIDAAFGPKTSFRLMHEKRIDEERITRREYEGDMNGLIALFISFSDSPRKGGMQALITAARVDRKTDLRK